MKIKNILSLLMVFAVFVNAQTGSINNTLGTGGSFIVKDGAADYLSVSQTTGNLSLFRNLELGGTINSTSTAGVITKNGQPFIHNYKPANCDGFNTFIGLNAGNFTMSGTGIQASWNTGAGYQSLTSLTTGFSNSAFGNASLYSNTTGYYNSAFGNLSLNQNTTGIYNSAFGHNSLLSNTTGLGNSAFGAGSLFKNTMGIGNSAFGSFSLNQNTTGQNNSAFGESSLTSNGTGFHNSAFGSGSLANNTTGNYNSAFGNSSLFYNTTGDQNSAYGSNSLLLNTTGSNNTALGYDALRNNTTGFQNTAVGHHSLQNNTGNYNTAIGHNAGSTVTTGFNLTLIGIDANPSSPTATDQITLGNQFVTSLRCNVQTITSLSDQRDKNNIKDLSLGLDFLMKVKPREFNWDRREWYENGISDGSKIQDHPTAGFIAQEFDSLQNTEHAEWLNLVLKNNPDKWEATYGNLLPVIVKAIQELKNENDQLKSEVENLRSLKEQLVEIESLKEELADQIKMLNSEKENENLKFSSNSD